ncbi:hypothetical protein [Micromonospora tarensis]|uniref:Uncharacterized protein n=1 Tax=Micromonospora tarensis TaxID=2806100 RepID=A0ABS1YCT0_9ACTN|nr:hypothetical protein [Micromonospora tarensis]MBM0275099.1 hypothetical protein [Micromonospora tarensis]
MADLFELVDLRKLLRESEIEFDSDAATVARRQAGGWLSDATGLTDWPDPIPDRLWTWAIELGAIAYRNPDGASEEQSDDHRVRFDRARRAEILTAARAAYPSASPPGPAAAGPLWSFPAPDWSWGQDTYTGREG